MIVDILGWTGNFFFLLATYLLGKKNIKGFYANMLGNVMYIGQCQFLHNSALFWVSIMLIIVNIKAIIEWKQKKKQKK